MATTKRTPPSPRSVQGKTRAGEATRPRNFQAQASGVINDLRSAIVAIIGALPGAEDMRRAADLQKRLDLDSKLAWQIHKVAFSADPVAEAASLPKSSAMRRFVKIAAEHGVPKKLTEAAEKVVDRFDELIREHAGDRNAFDSMISSMAGNGSDPIDLTYKRTSFNGNSHIWGVQAKAQLSCAIIHPSATNPDRGDGLALRGFVGLRRFRPNAPVIITRSEASDNDGVVRHQFTREPLDAEGPSMGGVTVLREFCSSPLPGLKQVTGQGRTITIEMEEDVVGNQSRMTCLTGDVVRGALPRYRDQHNSCEIIRGIVRLPCEVLVHDVLVHEDMYGGPVTPEVSVYSTVGGEPSALPREIDRLPMRETVLHLGRGPSALHTPDVPRYVEMVQWALERVDWDGSKFDVYRCRVEYPVMPSSVVMEFDLPEAPSAAPKPKPA